MLIHRSSYALGSRHTHTHTLLKTQNHFFLMCHNKNLHKISCSFQFRIINFMPNNSLDLNLKGEHFILKYYRRKIPSEAEKVRPMLLKPMLSLSLWHDMETTNESFEIKCEERTEIARHFYAGELISTDKSETSTTTTTTKMSIVLKTICWMLKLNAQLPFDRCKSHLNRIVKAQHSAQKNIFPLNERARAHTQHTFTQISFFWDIILVLRGFKWSIAIPLP